MVIDFTRQSFSCTTLDELVKAMFNSIAEYSLVGSLLVTAFNKPLYFFSDGLDRPLEKEVLSAVHCHSEHIISFSKRVIFNIPNGSLLIRNMPDDEDMVGRLRDHLALLMDALNSRIGGLSHEHEIITNRKNLKNMMKTVQVSLDNIEQQRKDIQVENNQIMSNMASAIEDSFVSLGLSGEQEDTLQAIVSTTESEMDNMFKKNMDIDKRSEKILQDLKSALLAS